MRHGAQTPHPGGSGSDRGFRLTLLALVLLKVALDHVGHVGRLLDALVLAP